MGKKDKKHAGGKAHTMTASDHSKTANGATPARNGQSGPLRSLALRALCQGAFAPVFRTLMQVMPKNQMS
jgi:hypothetical protein